MSNNFVNRFSNEDLKGFLYCTACIKVTEGNDYNAVYDELLSLSKDTILEEGCIEFIVAPSNKVEKEFILWEIWKDEEALKLHHTKPFVQEYFKKNLTEIKWFQTAIVNNN